jgi:hypothetical protein
MEETENFMFLTEKEVNFIKRYNFDIQYSHDRILWCEEQDCEFILKCSIILMEDYDRYDIIVIKNDDDMYYMEIDGDYYKCDQIYEFKDLIKKYIKR